MLADAIGFLTLLVIVAVTSVIAGAQDTGYLMAGSIYLSMAFTAHYFWHQENMPITPQQWLRYSIWVAVIGGAVFLIEGVLGQIFNPAMKFVEGALHWGGGFGGTLTAIATLGMCAIGLAGLVRSFFVARPKV